MSNCTDPLLNDDCTVLLVHSNHDQGSAVFTDAGDGPNCPHILTSIHNSIHSECQAVFCKSSLFFPNTWGGISTPDHVDFTFDADFTYDFWFMTLRTPLMCILGLGNANNAGIGEISVNRTATKLTYLFAGAIKLTSASIINDGCLHHCAILRTGSSLRLYIDGVLEDSLSPFNDTLDGTHFIIGLSHANTIPFFGFFDEFRVSKGVARWTANFTPPTAPYSYVCFPPEAVLSGTVKEKGVAVIRTLMGFIRSTGELYSQTVSLADGTFTLDAPDDTTEMVVVAFDDDAGDQYNALIYDRVKGITV